MGAPVTQFVDIQINLTGAVATRFGFGTPIGVFEHNITPNRIDGPYVDIAAVSAAGFTPLTAPEIYFEATAAFAVESGVDQILIGRRVQAGAFVAAKVWQFTASGSVFVDETADFNSATDADWAVLPAVDAAGNYAAVGMGVPFPGMTLDNANGTAGTVGAVTWEYWNGTAWTALAGVTDGTTDFTIAAADGQIVTWTVPVDWAALALNGEALPLYYVRAVSDGNYAILPVYDQGVVDLTATDATWTATMDAIEALELITPAKKFYGINIESRVAADILEVAAWTEARQKVFSAQTADADVLAGTPGNVLDDLEGFAYARTFGTYRAVGSGTANGYFDSAWLSKILGLNLDVPGGVGIAGFMQLAGIAGDNITPTQVAAIYADNGNVYTDAGSLTFTSEGLMAAGKPRFIDVTTSVDWLDQRSQEAILSLLVGVQTKIPYTDGGINQVVAAWQAVLDAGVTNGHLSPDDPPKITAPLVSAVSAADKANRILTLTATATLAGAIQKVVLVLNLSF